MRIVAVIVGPEGADLFDERNIKIEITSECDGEWVQVTQNPEHFDAQPQTIEITPEEWPALRKAINKMIKECRS